MYKILNLVDKLTKVLIINLEKYGRKILRVLKNVEILLHENI